MRWFLSILTYVETNHPCGFYHYTAERGRTPAAKNAR